jgi:hypothetical protein
MFKKVDTLLQSNRVFAVLVIFRWAALIPALLTFNTNSRPGQLFSPVSYLTSRPGSPGGDEIELLKLGE